MNDETEDLRLSRLIKAPAAKVWAAWSKPEHLARWWLPAPLECKVVQLDIRPGGGLETRMREEGAGDFKPHVEGCFLEVVAERRLVWTTCLVAGWRPVEPWLALTAQIDFEPEGDSTRYSARVMHRNPEDSRRHLDLGFYEGWGTVIGQLADYVAALD